MGFRTYFAEMRRFGCWSFDKESGPMHPMELLPTSQMQLCKDVAPGSTVVLPFGHGRHLTQRAKEEAFWLLGLLGCWTGPEATKSSLSLSLSTSHTAELLFGAVEVVVVGTLFALGAANVAAMPTG